jgi:hypothetical protein
LLTALARSPDARFRTAKEMHRALEAYAQGAGMFLSPVATAELVEEVLGPRLVDSGPSSNSNLPGPVDVPAEAPAVPVADPDALLHDDERATLRRVGGMQLLTLRGALDERFDPRPLMRKLHGELLVDTAGVERVTSFGIRSLLTLWTETRASVRALYHVRCSVPFVSQVLMIRGVLGGGNMGFGDGFGPSPLDLFLPRRNYRYYGWFAPPPRMSLPEAIFGRDAGEKQQARKRLADQLPLRPLVRFLYLYLWKWGFLDGRAGFNYCVLMAFYDYLIQLKVIEQRQLNVEARA